MGRIAANAPCLIVVLRTSGTIVYFSPFAEALTGYMAADVLGKDFYLTFMADPGLRTLAGAEIPTCGVECPIVCKNGAYRWIVWNSQALANYHEDPALLMVGQDITTLKQAQDQALQSERLAAIGQMMTGLAHESGNALARSQACLEMLTFTVENQPKAVDLIKRIQSAQDHLKQLYDEVRNYAAPLKLDLGEWNLALIWRQAWDNLALMRKASRRRLAKSKTDLTCASVSIRFGSGRCFAISSTTRSLPVLIRSRSRLIVGPRSLPASRRCASFSATTAQD